MNSLGFLNEFTRIPQWIQQWVHLNSSMNKLKFTDKFIWIHQQIDLNSFLSNSLKFINEFDWIHLQILFNISIYIHLKYLQIFWKYHSFLLFGCFEKIVNEFTNEFIKFNLRLKSFLILVILLNFLSNF